MTFQYHIFQQCGIQSYDKLSAKDVRVVNGDLPRNTVKMGDARLLRST